MHMYGQIYGGGGYGHQYKPHKERGGCLTIWLVLGTLGCVMGLFKGCMPDRESMEFFNDIFANPPEWYYLVSGLVNFMQLICLAGMWMWQKWGFYGLVILSVIGVIVGGMVGVPIVWGIIGTAINLGIWWWLISPHWDSFE